MKYTLRVEVEIQSESLEEKSVDAEITHLRSMGQDIMETAHRGLGNWPFPSAELLEIRHELTAERPS